MSETPKYSLVQSFYDYAVENFFLSILQRQLRGLISHEQVLKEMADISEDMPEKYNAWVKKATSSTTGGRQDNEQ